MIKLGILYLMCYIKILHYSIVFRLFFMILFKVYVVIKKTKVCLNGWNTEACEEEAVKLRNKYFMLMFLLTMLWSMKSDL